MDTDDTRYRAIDCFQLDAVDANDDDGTLTWDEQTRVTIDNQPWEDAFGTDTFHKAEYVVTKPAEQPYYVDGEQKTFTKPRDALKEAQWRLDNLPWTIEHPVSKRVVSIDEARGFWRGPYYVDDDDEQRVALYIPAIDDEALAYAADNEGVSVGFTHTLTAVDEYDGTIGGDVDVENVDALQTDIYYDHVATVKTPRLPDSGRVAGDALPSTDDADTPLIDDSVVADSGVGITAVDAMTTQTKGGNGDDSSDSQTMTDAPQGIHVDDGTWYAIAPSETSDGTAKYPLTSCTGEDSIESAWHLRGHGHYDIDQSTLEERIQRAASAMGCEMDLDTDTTNDTQTTTMTDDNGLTLDDMSVDAIAEQHDGVADIVEQNDSLEREVDELEEQKDALADERDTLKEELDSYKEAEQTRELNERIDTLTDLTDRWEEEELREMDVDSHEEHVQRLDERIEIFEDITDASTPTADEGDGGDEGGNDEYAPGTVMDLSNTA